MHQLVAQLAQLSLNERQTLLASLLEDGSDYNVFPLSFAQQRLWFLEQMDPGNPTYNLSATVRLQGKLDTTALLQALQVIGERHESLHTIFVDIDGHPLQVIDSTIKTNIPLIDLSGEADLNAQHLYQEADRPFNLSEGPIWRAILLKLANESHILLVTMHHIISDGWSITVLAQELATCYQALAANQPNPLPPLPIQYVDFTLWQREQLQGETLARHVDYWRGQLADAPPLLALPTDKPRPSMQTFVGKNLPFHVSAPLARQLRALGQIENASLFMVILSAWQLLLGRYSGQDDVVVGTLIANREQPELERLIGFFVNTLVLRAKLSPSLTFRRLLQQVRQTTLQAYQHQALPFEKLLEELQPERNTSYSPLFQTMLVVQNITKPQLELPDLTLTIEPREDTHAPHDMTMWLWQQEDESLRGQLNYAVGLFDENTMSRMLAHFQQLLQAITVNPDQPIYTLPLLTPTEKQEILYTWNQTKITHEKPTSLLPLIQKQARHRPQSIAIRTPTHKLTYQELDQRSNQLAHYLKRQGVHTETPIAVYLEPGPTAVIALLAILKAGGAYIPLDVASPSERLTFMLADIKPHFILCQTHFKTTMPVHTIPIIDVDVVEARVAQEATTEVTSRILPAQLAYTIYTSGSTGKPKGVQIAHHSLLNLLQAMAEQPGLTAEDTFLAVTTLSFDIAALELFLPLIVGATLVVIPRDAAVDGNRLAHILTELEITAMQATPATWQMLLTAGWTGKPNLKVLCGGEALPTELATQLATGNASLWNMYGPTETTIWSLVQAITAPKGMIPIGKPIANTQTYILDQQGQPVPVGVWGELHIGGAGLARGYWQRPQLTAEKFVPDPFSQCAGSRLYRTGDMARYRADGVIEFMGRIDHQIKLHGFRIELDEISTALNQHDAIRQAVVTVHQADKNKQLAAYFVPEQGTLEDEAMAFSLFYFAADETWQTDNKYQLYLEGAAFADQHGFTAVWTPERHFHAVAGLYPNPSVLSSALAMITKNVQLRAGSVVLPLHNPLRVAEEWSVVDNLSRGRVGLAFASGWVPNDFAFFPQHYAHKREIMLEGIQTLQQLWQGQKIRATDGLGNPIDIGIFPKPIQAEIPIWLTCTGNPAMFEQAGALGFGVLTALLSQTVEELADNIGRYHQALNAHGHPPEKGQVTLMLHTFLGEDFEQVIAEVEKPFCNYMRSHVGLIETMTRSLQMDIDIHEETDIDHLVTFAFERYIRTASLIGTPATALKMVRKLQALGVDEIACLIDFGMPKEAVMESLKQVVKLKQTTNQQAVPNTPELRRFLQQKLPAYMIPSVFVPLSEFPLTPNGKIDRKVLPQPHPVSQQTDFVPAKTPTEQIIAGLWAQLLPVSKVSVLDNFFDIGGQSLIATQLIARIRAHFVVDITVRDLFMFPTVRELANHIETLIVEQASSTTIDDLLTQLDEIDEATVVRLLATKG